MFEFLFLLACLIGSSDTHFLGHPLAILFFIDGALFEILSKRLVYFLSLLDSPSCLHQLDQIVFTHVVGRDKVIQLVIREEFIAVQLKQVLHIILVN